MTDAAVEHPPHYTATKFECIEVIEALDLGFHVGNVLRYLWRAKHKGRHLEDIKKERWYLDREIERVSKYSEEKK